MMEFTKANFDKQCLKILAAMKKAKDNPVETSQNLLGTYFSQLPKEILDKHIRRYLSGRDLNTLAQVNKTFLRWAHQGEFWGELFNSHFPESALQPAAYSQARWKYYRKLHPPVLNSPPPKPHSAPKYFFIVGCYDAAGDDVCPNCCPYVGCCGRVPEEFPLCGGCCGGQEDDHPILELPCICTCWCWPCIWGFSFCTAHLFSCCCSNCCHVATCSQGCNCGTRIVPYESDLWQDEYSKSGPLCLCCGQSVSF